LFMVRGYLILVKKILEGLPIHRFDLFLQKKVWEVTIC